MSLVITGQRITLSRLEIDCAQSQIECPGEKKKENEKKRVYLQKRQKYNFLCADNMTERKDTEDMHEHVCSSQMIKAVCKNVILRFNPTRCKGQVGYTACLIHFPLRKG